MSFGQLVCEPLSVGEVIADPNLDSKLAAVHGLFYLGEGCRSSEYLLLSKDGPFDGVGPIPMPESLDRSACMLIEQPGLSDKLGSSGTSGAYFWKHDCVLVGRIRHCPGTDHPFRIGDLWAMLLQDWLSSDWGVGRQKGLPYHLLRLVLFSPSYPGDSPGKSPTSTNEVNPMIRLGP